MVKNVFAEHSLTCAGDWRGWMGIRWWGGGGCISLPHPLQSHSTFHNPGQDRTSGRLCIATSLLPLPLCQLCSARRCRWWKAIWSSLASNPPRPAASPLAPSGAQSHRKTVWGQSTLPPHCSAEACRAASQMVGQPGRAGGGCAVQFNCREAGVWCVPAGVRCVQGEPYE